MILPKKRKTNATSDKKTKILSGRSKGAKTMNRRSELLEIVDSSGKVIGLAERSEFHGNPSMIHRVVHVLVFNKTGQLLLQKRSKNKDTAPGKWDTSAGGHINPDEDTLDAARREMQEELGISGCELFFLHKYLYSSLLETELVNTYACVYNGKILYNKEEIDEVGYWNFEDISGNFGSGLFSNNFECEISACMKMSGCLNLSFLSPENIFMDLEIKPDIKPVFNYPSCKK
ncbi:MAG: NUDIX domain-containing protein [Nitrospirota bacterium]